MHAFSYQIYDLKIKSKINLKFKIIIYIYIIYQEKLDFNIFLKNMYVNFIYMKPVVLIPLLEFYVGTCMYVLKFFF